MVQLQQLPVPLNAEFPKNSREFGVVVLGVPD
jgi:hypothetical protein